MKKDIPQKEKAQPQNAPARRKSQRKVREEEAQNNDLGVGESEGESEEKRSLKTKAQKLKFSRKPKSHTIGALTPLIRTCHVAMTHVVPPPHTK